MIKGIIFDLDGTLLSTDNDLCTAVNDVRAFFRCEPLDIEVIKSYLGDGIRMLVTRSLPNEYLMYLEDAIELFHAFYASCYNDTTVPYESVMETLKELQENYKLSVVSNKAQKYVDQLIEFHFSEIRFEYVYGDDLNHKRKPDAQGIIESMNHMGCTKDEIILVGDSTVDIETAQLFGIPVCPVAWGFQSKELLYEKSRVVPIERMSDLILFLNQLNYN